MCFLEDLCLGPFLLSCQVLRHFFILFSLCQTCFTCVSGLESNFSVASRACWKVLEAVKSEATIVCWKVREEVKRVASRACWKVREEEKSVAARAC